LLVLKNNSGIHNRLDKRYEAFWKNCRENWIAERSTTIAMTTQTRK